MVPYHAASNYIDTLIEQGYKVAICEQVEDPKTTKGMVKREVVQLITPGTVMDSKGLSAKENNFDSCFAARERFGFAYVDLSTGELKAAQLEDEEAVVNEAAALQTKEVVLCSEIPESLQTTLTNRLNVVFSKQETLEENAEFHFNRTSLQELEKVVTGKLLSYLAITQNAV